MPVSRCLFRFLLHPRERVRHAAALGLQRLFLNTAATFDQKRALLRGLGRVQQPEISFHLGKFPLAFTKPR